MDNPNTIGTGQAGDDAFPDVSTLSYEQARDELVETVKILELGQMSLDESLNYWERGEAWPSGARCCSTAPHNVSSRPSSNRRRQPQTAKNKIIRS